MNSIEAAKKAMKDNEEHLKVLRSEEEATRRWIVDIETSIERIKKSLKDFEEALQQRNNELEAIKDEKFVVLVENAALIVFIAQGGGPDMLD